MEYCEAGAVECSYMVNGECSCSKEQEMACPAWQDSHDELIGG